MVAVAVGLCWALTEPQPSKSEDEGDSKDLLNVVQSEMKLLEVVQHQLAATSSRKGPGLQQVAPTLSQNEASIAPPYSHELTPTMKVAKVWPKQDPAAESKPKEEAVTNTNAGKQHAANAKAEEEAVAHSKAGREYAAKTKAEEEGITITKTVLTGL